MKPRFPKRFSVSLLPFKGGFDTMTPPFELAPGKVIRSQNWYQSVNGGYRTYQGHERYDGQPKPSTAVYSVLPVFLTGAVAVNDVVTDTGTASGTVIAISSNEDNKVTNSNDLTGWWPHSTPILTTVTGLDVTHTGTQITDDDTVNAEYVEKDITFTAPLSPVELRVFVAKETSATANALLGLLFTGTADEYSYLSVNLQNGTAEIDLDDTGTLTYQVTTAAYNSDYWEVSISATPLNTSNNEVDICLGPAVYSSSTATWDGTMTGTMTVGNVELYFDKAISDIVGTDPQFVGTTSITNYLVLSKNSGTFTAGTIYVAAVDVGTCTGAQVANGASSLLLSAQYKNLAADLYRADITTVPGSGSVLGVTALNDIVYAFRNNAAGTAAQMYASSTTGWTLCDLGETINFNAGTAAFLVDETLTGGTSAATGTIKKVIVTSGSWAGADATGRIILYSVSGTFASGETVTSASGSATSTSANAANTLQPSGSFKTIVTNFTGSTDTVRIYGCDGASTGFEWDGSVFVPILTGMTSDKPTEVYEHKSQLFFSFHGSIQNSSPGAPYDWSPITGASEIAMGDTVTGFLTQPGNTPTLAIFTENETAMLYGSGVADWNLIVYKDGVGAKSRSMQAIGNTFMLGTQGILKLSTSQKYGNFVDATLSQNIHDWITGRFGSFTCSCVVKDQNLYCLFFSDKTALFVTIDNGEVVSFMPLLFPQIVKCCFSYQDSSGNEVIMFGDENGYIYQMFKGTSLDGDNNTSFLYLAYDNLKTPQLTKRYRRVALEVSGDGYFDFDFSYTLDYGASIKNQPVSQNATLSVAPLFFDSGLTFDSGLFFGSTNISPIEFPMNGTGMNVSMSINSDFDYCNSVLFSGAMVQYTYAQEIRR